MNCEFINPLECKDSSATSTNMKLACWPLIGGLVQRGDWVGRGPQAAQAPPCCTKCNSPAINGQCTNHRIAVGPYGLLLCGSNVPLDG